MPDGRGVSLMGRVSDVCLMGRVSDDYEEELDMLCCVYLAAPRLC